MVRIVPELCGDEYFGTGDAGGCYSFADCGLGAVAWIGISMGCSRLGLGVHSGGVDVPVACFQRSEDCCFLCVGILPCTEAQGRDVCSCVQFESRELRCSSALLECD